MLCQPSRRNFQIFLVTLHECGSVIADRVVIDAVARAVCALASIGLSVLTGTYNRHRIDRTESSFFVYFIFYFIIII